MPQAGKVFVSYSRADRDYVSTMAARLREAGVDLWIDVLDIPAGRNWDDAVEQALKTCSRILVVLSPDSVASANVRDEIGDALDRGAHIIPVLIRACDVPFRIKRLQRFDFITREDSDFPRLIAALQGGEALQNPILVKEQTPSVSDQPRHFRTSRRGWQRWAVASAVLIALAAVGLYF